MSSHPAAWYPDPSNPAFMRYWDGEKWTEHTQPVAPQAQAPFSPPTGFSAVSPQQQPQRAKPDSYLIWSILATLFCCLPFGIVSIVNAVKVDSAWAMGHYQEAEERSAAAKKWAVTSALIAVGVSVVYFILMVVLGVSASESSL
jgi:hypothetical protein